MSNRHRSLPTALTLAIGLGLGWFAARYPSGGTLQAKVGGDRFGDYALTTAPVRLQVDERTKQQTTQDALFFIDYRGARLVATIPSLKQSASGTQVIDSFAERDLAADFRFAEGAPPPHFLMTSASFGAAGVEWSPLFVFETTSKQVGVYRLQTQVVGTKSAPKFEMLELRSYAAQAGLPPLPGAPGA